MRFRGRFKALFSFCIILVAWTFSLLFQTCKQDPLIVSSTDYPKDIAYILLSKCAVSGCHNDASAPGAAHLNLTSWAKLFNGSSNGSVVIPFRADFSPLMYYINTYPDIGPANYPTMPIQGAPLSKDQVNLIKTWINNGAPDANGNVAFSGNLQRKKFYVVNQGCRVVTVFDAATKLPMRYISIADPTELNTAPHQVKLSPDGKYWYVCFIGGSYIKRYNTTDDSFDSKVFVGNASWNTMAFTPNGKFLFAVDWSTPIGKVVKCDLTQMKVIDSALLADKPHGSCVSPDGQNVFITATGGNYLYKINVDSLSKPGSYNYVAFDAFGVSPSSNYNPHETLFSPDGSKYYVTCSGNNNVGDLSIKVFNSATDNLITSIPLQSGVYEMSYSKNKNLLFASSYDGTYQGYQGRIAVIDMTTNTHLTDIVSGTQPHGLAVDDAAGLLYVANRNISNTTPPHHTSICGGSNGNLVFIDLNTLQQTGIRVELSRDPYSVNIRF